MQLPDRRRVLIGALDRLLHSTPRHCTTRSECECQEGAHMPGAALTTKLVRSFGTPSSAAMAPPPTAAMARGRETPAPPGNSSCIRSPARLARLWRHSGSQLIGRRNRPSRPHHRSCSHSCRRRGPLGARSVASLIFAQLPSARVAPREAAHSDPRATRTRPTWSARARKRCVSCGKIYATYPVLNLEFVGEP